MGGTPPGIFYREDALHRRKPMLSPIQALFATVQRIPLTLKMLLATLLASTIMWALLDHWQSRHLKELFQTHQMAAVEEKARENRRILDSQIRRHHQAVKLLSSQSRLIDHLLRLQDQDNLSAKIHTSLPPWLPNASMLRSFVPLRYVLLIGPDSQVRELYQGVAFPPPPSLLQPSFLLQQLSHNQTLLTKVDGLPFLVASEIILDHKGNLKGTLMMASPLDDTFLTDVQGLAQSYSGIVALMEGEQPIIIASNQRGNELYGLGMATIKSRYLVAGASFFDYGSSDLLLQLVTLVSSAEFESLNRSILSAERRQRAYTAVTLILTCLAVMLWITGKIRQVTRRLMEFTRETLGVSPTTVHLKDELLILQEQFEGMIHEIVRGRDDLKRELDERKQAEKEIRKLSQAVEQNPAAVIITDLDGAIQYVNPEFSRLTGYASAEALGKNPGFLKSGETPPATYGELWETIRMGRVWQGVLRNRRKDGRCYWEMNIIAAVRNESGEITNFLAIKEDITPRIDMEHALQEAKIAAETANQVKNEFLANITHELRTPLNGITGITHLLMDEDLGPLNKNQKKHLKNQQECTSQLSNLINDLLDISRVDTDEFVLEQRPFPLHDLMMQAVATMTEQAAHKGLAMGHHIDPTTPEEVVGDAFRFRQILLNLLRNAVKFTQQGSIVLAARWESEQVHITVTDTGIGIPVEKQQAIFEPFTQVQGAANREFGGSGVGLFIARRLVEMMSGRIWVESTAGRGSIFHLAIPFVVAPALPAALPSQPVITEEDLAGLSVLVVGRNPLNRMILKKLLLKMALQVVETDDCHGAMALMASASEPGPYRMVFLDCYQWETDRETIMDHLSVIPEEYRVPIILVAAEKSSNAAGAPPPGIYKLAKPLKREEAFDTIRAALLYRGNGPEDPPS